MADTTRSVDIKLNVPAGDLSGLEAGARKAEAYTVALRKLDQQARATFQALHDLQQKERTQGSLSPQDQRRLTLARGRWQQQMARTDPGYTATIRPWAVEQVGEPALGDIEALTQPGRPVYTARRGAQRLAQALRSPAARMAPTLSPASDEGAQVLARAVAREQTRERERQEAQERSAVTALRQRVMAAGEPRLQLPLGTGESPMGMLRSLRWSNADAERQAARESEQAARLEEARATRRASRAQTIQEHQGVVARMRLRNLAQGSGEPVLFPQLPRPLTPQQQAARILRAQRTQSQAYLERLRWQPGQEESEALDGMQRLRQRAPRLFQGPVQIGTTTYANAATAAAASAAAGPPAPAAAGGGGAGRMPPPGGGAPGGGFPPMPPVPPSGGGAPAMPSPPVTAPGGGGGSGAISTMLAAAGGTGTAMGAVLGKIPIIGPALQWGSKFGLAKGTAVAAGLYMLSRMPEAMDMYEEKALGVLKVGTLINTSFERTEERAKALGKALDDPMTMAEAMGQTFASVDTTLVALRKDFQTLPREALPAMQVLGRATGSLAGIREAISFGKAYGVTATEGAGLQARAMQLMGPGADINRMAMATPMYWDARSAQLVPMSKAGFVEQGLQVAGVGGFQAPTLSQDMASNIANFFTLGTRYAGQQANAFRQFAGGVQGEQSDPIQSLRYRAIGRLAERMGGGTLQIGKDMEANLGTWRGRRLAAQQAASSPEVLQAYAEEALRYAGGNEELARDLFQGIMGQQDIGFTNKVFDKWRNDPTGFASWYKELPQPTTRERIEGTEQTQGRDILDAQAKFGEVLLDTGAMLSKAKRLLEETAGDMYSSGKIATTGLGEVYGAVRDMVSGLKDFRTGTMDAVEGLSKFSGLLERIERMFGFGVVLDRLPKGEQDPPSAAEQAERALADPANYTTYSRFRGPTAWAPGQESALLNPRRPQ